MTKKYVTLEPDPSIMERNMRIIQESPIETELNNIFNQEHVPYKPVVPKPGFCVKTFMKPDNKKLFVNICTTDAIPCPRDLSEDELIEILNSDDPSNFRVPMSLGEGRQEKDKSGSSVTVYDVAIHPDFFNKIEKKPLFRTFLLTVVFEGLQDKYQLELDMMNYIILKHKKCLGTLQTHRIQQRDILRAQAQDTSKPTLIEELDDGRKNEIVYRLRREPPTGEINYLLAEFKIPASIELSDLNLEVGEDRVVLDSKGVFDVVDFFLPCNIDQDSIDAQLNRNSDMLTVKMPVV